MRFWSVVTSLIRQSQPGPHAEGAPSIELCDGKSGSRVRPPCSRGNEQMLPECFHFYVKLHMGGRDTSEWHVQLCKNRRIHNAACFFCMFLSVVRKTFVLLHLDIFFCSVRMTFDCVKVCSTPQQWIQFVLKLKCHTLKKIKIHYLVG